MMREGQRLVNGYVCFEEDGKLKKVHIELAKKALGKDLPDGVEVHHVNEVRSDNRPENLVICPDASYHHLLHRRARAYDACGNADWMKCKFCQQWDDPKNLYLAGGLPNVAHRVCATEYRRKQRAALKEKMQ